MTRQGYTLENTRKNMAMTRQNPWHDKKILKAKQEKKLMTRQENIMTR